MTFPIRICPLEGVAMIMEIFCWKESQVCPSRPLRGGTTKTERTLTEYNGGCSLRFSKIKNITNWMTIKSCHSFPSRLMQTLRRRKGVTVKYTLSEFILPITDSGNPQSQRYEDTNSD